jgi:hypothetical protein
MTQLLPVSHVGRHFTLGFVLFEVRSHPLHISVLLSCTFLLGRSLEGNIYEALKRSWFPFSPKPTESQKICRDDRDALVNDVISNAIGRLMNTRRVSHLISSLQTSDIPLKIHQ